jgi:hypothetical protein
MTAKAHRTRPTVPATQSGWTPIRGPETIEPRPSRPIGLELDGGIAKTVDRLRSAGVETYESCEGGPGHAYPEPTIAFRGGSGEGWRAMSLCLTWGLPVSELRRVWDVLDRNEPTGPYWKIVFSRRPG